VKYKAITLYQPWASLWMLEEKRYETRSWATRYRGQLVIHAGKSKRFLHLCSEPFFLEALKRHGLANPEALPLGAVLGWGKLSSVVPSHYVGNSVLCKDGISQQEEAFGDFSRGRFAWWLDCRTVLRNSIPARGRQGLWTWEAPCDLSLLDYK